MINNSELEIITNAVCQIARQAGALQRQLLSLRGRCHRIHSPTLFPQGA